jgi:hypothetical protein
MALPFKSTGRFVKAVSLSLTLATLLGPNGLLSAAPPDAGMSLIRGALLVGRFRTQAELNATAWEDQRNTLIVELAGRTRNDVRFYQGLSDSDLAGAGALLVYLRETGSRTDAQIKTLTADDMRNIVIVEVGVQTGRGSDLQGLSNLQLVELVMGPERGYIRGVLLVGRFRTQRELLTMPGEDQRNTLIVELANRTRDGVSFYQGLNDRELAGAGALLVYLRLARSRTDAQIKTMSADDMRNTVIVEMNAQVHRTDLQTLTNLQLALTALGSKELRSVDTLPEALRPGRHTMVLRPHRWHTWVTTKSYSDVPFFGIFIGRNVDCTRGFTVAPFTTGEGAGLSTTIGWGQVEGDGHPDSSTDQCVSWVTQAAIDFDVRELAAVPRKSVDRVVLSYREQAAPRCMSMVYTQGGFLTDHLPCWTDGDGRPVQKPEGCVSVQVPNEEWVRDSPVGRPVGWDLGPTGIQKVGASSWDVTGPFRARHAPGLGGSPVGPGYVLIGEALFTRNLSADDNTRCTSQVSDLRLEATYTVPPITAEYEQSPPS